MGYELNSKAFEILTQIEVGIREFLILLIKEKGIKNWVSSFLGSVQKENLNDIVKRIDEAYKNSQIPQIEDQYIYKINKVKNSNNLSYNINKLYHPFYYLNWSDMDSLIRNKTNTPLLDQKIGKFNREILVDNLTKLNHLRNDIAHSRFISIDDYNIISGFFTQINGLIPNFQNYCLSQSTEEMISTILSLLSKYISLIENTNVLSNHKLEEINIFLNKCENSFWLNSIENELLNKIVILNKEILKYYEFRNKSGGLLEIYKIKNENNELFKNIRKLTENGQI